jgi:hypothetical protein
MLLTSSPHQVSTTRDHATSNQTFGNKSKLVVRGRASSLFFFLQGSFIYQVLLLLLSVMCILECVQLIGVLSLLCVVFKCFY